MSRPARWVLAVLVLQAVLVASYWLVEHGRVSKTLELLGTDPPQRVDRPMPSLSVIRRDGSREELPSPGRRTLVHVWATWCPPCRSELPGLLEVPSRHDVDVVAVALDEKWEDVEPLLGETSTSDVVLAKSADVEQRLGIETLPVTFLVEATGRIALRFEGARDWTDRAFIERYVSAQVDGGAGGP